MLYDPHDDLIGQRARGNYEPQPLPLYGSTHAHRHLRGSLHVENVGWIRLAQASATYAPPLCDIFARCASLALKTIDRAKLQCPRKGGLINRPKRAFDMKITPGHTKVNMVATVLGAEVPGVILEGVPGGLVS